MQNNYFNPAQAASSLRYMLAVNNLQQARTLTRKAMRLNAKNRAAFLLQCRRQEIQMQDILTLLGVI